MEGQTWQRIDFDIRFSIRDQAEILRTWMLYFSQVVLYVPRMEDKLETCPVEIWVMNATCNDTLFEMVGSWVFDLSQLDPASNLRSDGFDPGAISRELIWVPSELVSPEELCQTMHPVPNIKSSDPVPEPLRSDRS